MGTTTDVPRHFCLNLQARQGKHLSESCEYSTLMVTLYEQQISMAIGNKKKCHEKSPLQFITKGRCKAHPRNVEEATPVTRIQH